MLAEVNIAISSKSAKVVMRIGEKVKDQEVWTFPAISRTEAKEVAESLFGDAYDFFNVCVHGDPEDEIDPEEDERPPDAEA